MVDLPVGMPSDILMGLKKTRICGQQMNITQDGEARRPRKRGGKTSAGEKLTGKGKGMGKGKPKDKARGKSKAKSRVRGKPKPAARKKKPKKPGK